MRKIIRTLEQFITENSKKWYRGVTDKTNESDYIWITRSSSLAKKYSDINKIIYGGDSVVNEYSFDESKFNILDLSDYDMDDTLEEYQLEDFLDELDIEFEASDLFDFSEDEIPLSRLVNNILEEIVKDIDGFKILESDEVTMYVRKDCVV
jgi:hypothetical protein